MIYVMLYVKFEVCELPASSCTFVLYDFIIHVVVSNSIKWCFF